jgi:hypothetical protein
MDQQQQQEERILAYSTFDPAQACAECEECGAKIPIELTICADCAARENEEN